MTSEAAVQIKMRRQERRGEGRRGEERRGEDRRRQDRRGKERTERMGRIRIGIKVYECTRTALSGLHPV